MEGSRNVVVEHTLLLARQCKSFACSAKHFGKHGVSRSQHLVLAHRVRVQTQLDRRNKLPIICRNCCDLEQLNAAEKYNASAELAEILCPACGMCYAKHKQHRPADIIEHRRASMRLDHDRKLGNPIECEDCHASESDVVARRERRGLPAEATVMYTKPRRHRKHTEKTMGYF